MIDIVVLIACTLCGYLCGKYIEKRILDKNNFYQDLRKYISLLKENVAGKQLELDKFNRNFSENCSKVFAEYLNDNKLKCKVGAAQRKNLEEFFGNLVCVSSEQLSNHIEFFEKVLSEDIKFVKEQEVAKSSVYSKVGALIGAIVGILLI